MSSKIQNQIENSMLFEDLAPMAKKRVAVVVGRFNPPTKGHYAIIDTVKKFIRKNKNLGLESAPAIVIISGGKSEEDKKRNPLTAEERELFMKASGKADGVHFFSAKNAFEAFSNLREKGFEPVAIAAGTDRIQDYIRILDKYFTAPEGKAIKHHPIHLERDEGAIETKKKDKAEAIDSALASLNKSGKVDTDIVSGSLARRAVELGYEPEFAKIVGLDHNPKLAKKLYDKIAAAIKEE